MSRARIPDHLLDAAHAAVDALDWVGFHRAFCRAWLELTRAPRRRTAPGKPAGGSFYEVVGRCWACRRFWPVTLRGVLITHRPDSFDACPGSQSPPTETRGRAEGRGRGNRGSAWHDVPGTLCSYCEERPLRETARGGERSTTCGALKCIHRRTYLRQKSRREGEAPQAGRPGSGRA